MQTNKLYLNGAWTDAKSEDVIEVENPVTQEIITSVPAASADDVESAVQGAVKAFPVWKDTPLARRIEILNNAVDFMETHKNEMAETVASELGCPVSFALRTHVENYLVEMRDILKEAAEYEFDVRHDGYRVWKEPVGVVACMTPWNYPLGQIVKKVWPALVTGNVVLLKPSSQTPLIAYHLAEALHEAGLPAGCFQLLPGVSSEIGHLLSTHPDIDMVTFTGSTAAGKSVAADAAEGIKRVLLELGGKSPALVLPGADLSLAAKKALDSIVYNVGQTCSALTRLIAPRADKEALEAALLARLPKYVVGDPREEEVTAGPLQSKRQYEKVKSFIQKGIEEGATLLAGGLPEEDAGYYIRPTIFTDVRNDWEIAREEIFGPVLSVLYYDTVEEGVAMANDTEYGLSSAVFGPQDEALRIAGRIRAGQCTVNEGRYQRNAPFGGYKHSGYGREGGVYGLEEFLEIKAVFVDDGE